MIEDFLYNLSYQPFYWKRFGVALRSWYFRMITMTDEDLKNKVLIEGTLNQLEHSST